jgi:hypothetical protein
MSEVEEIEEKDAIEDISYCLREVDSLELKNKLGEVSKELKKAQMENDSKKGEELLLKYQSIINKAK